MSRTLPADLDSGVWTQSDLDTAVAGEHSTGGFGGEGEAWEKDEKPRLFG